MSKNNLGDKFNHRVTLRLSDEQYSFLIKVSDLLGVSPSDYIRMSINTGMMSMKNNAVIKGALNGDFMKGMVGTNENVKTDSDNIV